LNRTGGELAALRNRYIHDSWTIVGSLMTRVDKRAKLEKPQSHRRKALRFKTRHDTTNTDLERLTERVHTVAIALQVATKSLRLWRSEGRRPRVWKQWLPASKPNARMLNYLAESAALEKPLHRLRYEFD
jgi:hypothetical protein